MQQLRVVDIVAPGRAGLNREARSTLLNPSYATKNENWRIDESGMLANRKGQLLATTTPITGTPNVETLFEYRKADGTNEVIVGWDGGLANSILTPESNDVSGAVVVTNGTWWMQNFNDKCLAFQSGQKLAVYSGSTFATVVESGGTAPSSGIAACVYGRVYQVDDTDGANLKYSGLLDETDWNSASSGSIDFSNIWTRGQDRITAIAGFNGSLVVFGMDHVVFIVDGSGSELGLDPTTAYVADVINGTGCVDQQTVQIIGETDLVYLSPHGLQSLGRLIQEKSNPTRTLSKTIRTDILEDYRGSTAGTIRSSYNSDEGLYWISFPSRSKSYAFDMRYPYQDAIGDQLVPVFQWTLYPTALLARENGTVLQGGAGVVFTYSGNVDNGTNIELTYESGWLDLGEEFANRIKILKKLGAIVFSSFDGNIVMKWATDFETTFNQYTKQFIDDSAAPSEWGVAEWGLDEFGGGTASQRIYRTPARDTGQYFKIGLAASTDQAFQLQQLELVAKLGRLA